MNYHQGMSSAELHIKAIFQWAPQMGSCPPFQKEEEDRKILGLFLENFVHVTSPLASKVELVGLCKDVKVCHGVQWMSLAVWHQVCFCLSSRSIQTESFHAISSVVDAAGKTTWLITGDGNLWSRFRSGAIFSFQFFTPMVVSLTSANAPTWQKEDLASVSLVVSNCSTGFSSYEGEGKKKKFLF